MANLRLQHVSILYQTLKWFHIRFRQLQREPVEANARVNDKQIVTCSRGRKTKMSPSSKPMTMQDFHANSPKI